MTRRVSVPQAREQLAELVDAVAAERDAVVVERDGRPVAVLISPDQYEHYQDLARRDFFALVAEIHRRNEDEDPDEVLREVTAIVEEVRQADYERSRRAEDGR